MITRFAPSPTGPLHLGHAYSAMLAHDMARERGGRFLLRIEDIDRSRSRPEWEALIFEDLRWLGLDWETPVMRQSERLSAYRAALEDLWRRGLLFACTCNRRDVLEAVAAPHEGTPVFGPDGVVYPGTCRARKAATAETRVPDGVALRLDMAMAVSEAGDCSFVETGRIAGGGEERVGVRSWEAVEQIGDVVLARKDMGTSYHLSVVLDDSAQGVTDVIRGEDLFEATKIHVILQRLLDLPTPRYHHHQLIRDEAGKRLAKRDDARSVRSFREAGHSPQNVRRMVGL